MKQNITFYNCYRGCNSEYSSGPLQDTVLYILYNDRRALRNESLQAKFELVE
ncbi:hypothetical protein J6590_102903, partial [Homalodisca vitripennis]